MIGITSLHVLVALEGSIILSINGPEGYSIDVDALHFEGDIVGQEGDSFDSRGVPYDGVPRADEGFEADSGFDELAISDDDEPLVGFGLDPKTGDEVG